MGSFSSKMRSIRNGVGLHKSSVEGIDDDTDREKHSTGSISGGMADNSTPRGQAGEKNSDGSNADASPSHEQHTTPKVGQSFSWLASSPVVLNTTTKEHKAKGKRPVAGREASGVTKNSNEKCLKSGHSAESLPSNTNRNLQPSPSTSAEEVDNIKRSSKHKNVSNASFARSGNFPVGFGVVGKEPSPRLSVRSRMTVRKSQRQTLSLENKDEECP